MAAAHEDGSHPKTVLLVDDSAYWAETIGAQLRNDGYAVSILYDGLAAVERIRSSPPDILITDFFLANLDGGKLCQVAKRLHVEPPIITIILTGGADRNLSRVPSQYADVVIAKNATDIVLGDLQRVLSELQRSPPAPSAQREVVGHERLHPRVLSAKLHGLKQHLDALHEGIGDAVIGVDAELRVYFLNTMALELLGTGEEAALALPVTSVLGIGEEHPLIGRIREVLSASGQRQKPLTVEVKGSTLRTTVFGLKSPDGKNTTLVIARDVSDINAVEDERAALSRRLQDTDKMAALGRLLAGISHEINNPLAAMMPNLDLLELNLKDLLSRAGPTNAPSGAGEEMFEMLRDTTEAVRRIAAIVAELRIFTHPQSGQGELCPIEDVLSSALSLVSNEVRFKARVERACGSTPSLVVDRTRLSQAFLNILLNAAQSIHGHDPEQNWIRVETRELDGGVLVEISNSGVTIPEDVLSKIFDPFFTTKPTGQGIGLGLAIAYETIRRHGGYIEVSSGPQPTLFRVWLPRDTGLALASARQGAEAPYGNAARLLIVDDEKLVRNSMRRLLERHHEVSVAADGEQALALLLARQFDVVICDLIMPNMTGMELYDAVRQQLPEQADRFVFLTGGTSSSDARDFLLRVPNPRAYKPVEPKKLAMLIAECLKQFSREKPSGSSRDTETGM